MEKILLRTERVRTVPRRFGWVDQRLLDHPDDYLRRCGSRSLALYLVLVLVGDARGMSYYSDKRLSAMLGWTCAKVREARQGLIDADLLAYHCPLYQVLSLRPAKPPEPSGAAAPEEFTRHLKEAGLL